MFFNKVKNFSIKKPISPFVYICGAGPGDFALLTLKTHYLLTKIADVVVYDRLISEDILSIIPRRVKKIYAGKSCRQHEMTQEEINNVLVEQALENQVVVRLKGGDPFIFGRGGEEMLHLLANNINFEIVPGVNAADGCAAYCNIPLTHRGIASSVTFLTGHQQKGATPSLDYKSLVAEDKTLVIYMGLTHLDQIANNLIENGMDVNMPAIAIYNGTTSLQKTCLATIGNIYNKTQEQEFISPTIIIIGKVVSLIK